MATLRGVSVGQVYPESTVWHTTGILMLDVESRGRSSHSMIPRRVDFASLIQRKPQLDKLLIGYGSLISRYYTRPL